MGCINTADALELLLDFFPLSSDYECELSKGNG